MRNNLPIFCLIVAFFPYLPFLLPRSDLGKGWSLTSFLHSYISPAVSPSCNPSLKLSGQWPPLARTCFAFLSTTSRIFSVQHICRTIGTIYRCR
jgi:hypothetical protein